MKYLYSWLSEYADLKSCTPEKLAEKISEHSFEVEGIEKLKTSTGTDALIEIETGKTNRVDALGYLGMAYEISAVFEKKPKIAFPHNVPALPKGDYAITMNKKYASQYSALYFDKVNVKKSPPWLQKRLKALGMKPVNNVVDITNYILLETAQPIHAFDADKIEGKKIKITSGDREKFTTLEGENVYLEPNDIVIRDAKKTIALAGIMGGKNTQVTHNTKRILLEIATFSPVPIRRTSWRLGLRTDAAHLFEKGIPNEFSETAVMRIIDLFDKILDIKPESINRKIESQKKQKTITLEKEYISQLLGYKVAPSVLEKKLTLLHCAYKKKKNAYQITPPFWRPDLTIAEDIIEEVGKLNGYSRIPEQMFVNPNIITHDPVISFKKELREKLLGLGFDEAYTYSFYSLEDAKMFEYDPQNHFEVQNPISSEQELMRISLLPNLKKIVHENLKHHDSVRFFEIGNIYTHKKTEQFHDEPKIGVAYSANKMNQKSLFLALKGTLETLFEHLYISYDYEDVDSYNGLVPALKIASKKGILIGYIGMYMDGKNTIIFAECGIHSLLQAQTTLPRFKGFSKYPTKTIDLALVVDKKVKWADVEDGVIKAKDVIRVELFDVYEGAQIGKGKKSIAFKIVFQSDKKTLTDEEVNETFEKIVKNLKKKFNATIRD